MAKRNVWEQLSGYQRDYYGGGLMLIIGLGAMYIGFSYETGSLSHMGPGFFPVLVGAVIAFVGLLIVLAADGNPEERGEYPRAEWRGWFCIVLSIVAFIVIGSSAGLLPATFAIVFISALGDRQSTFKSAFLLAAAMCVVCIVVFWWALQLQFPLLMWRN